jgi:hypothetical protein
MITFRLNAMAAITVGLGCTFRALAGPDWIEADHGDAGSSIITAQPVTIPVVGRIIGSLNTGVVADFEDVYLIRILGPTMFQAHTDSAGGGSADFDTQLWLFDANGLGLLGNDDAAAGVMQSQLLASSNDGTGVTLTTPGCYYLAISGFNNDPVSSGGAIFSQASATEISGPDGPGGAQPLSGWTGAGAVGNYAIQFITIPMPTVGGPACQPIATPTLSEWGLSVLTLLLLIAGAILIRRRSLTAMRAAG